MYKISLNSPEYKKFDQHYDLLWQEYRRIHGKLAQYANECWELYINEQVLDSRSRLYYSADKNSLRRLEFTDEEDYIQFLLKWS